MGTTILILEEREFTARRIAQLLCDHSSNSIAGLAADLNEAVETFRIEKPDVVLMSAGFLDRKGLNFLAECDRSAWGCKVIVTNIAGDLTRVIEAIPNGAKGFLQKGATVEELVDGVRAVLSGGTPISPSIARYMIQELNQPSRSAPQPEPKTVLTPRELEILTYLGRGFRRQDVAAKFNISPGTVGNHINNIYKKLEVNSNVSAVAKAGRIGLM